MEAIAYHWFSVMHRKKKESKRQLKHERRGSLVIWLQLLFSSLFSPQIEEIMFWYARRASIYTPSIFFSSLPSNQTPTKFDFSPIYLLLLLFSILPKIHQNHHLLCRKRGNEVAKLLYGSELISVRGGKIVKYF